MKRATSVTVWNDSVGKRMSITYTEIDDETGKIISDNKRFDRVITDPEVQQTASTLIAQAQVYVDQDTQ